MSGAREIRDDGGDTVSKSARNCIVQDAWLDLIAEVVIAEVLAEEQTKSSGDQLGSQEDAR